MIDIVTIRHRKFRKKSSGYQYVAKLDGGGAWSEAEPKLLEAYRTLCGRELEGAHDAMVDVRACAAVYFALRDLPAVAPPPGGA